MCLLFICHRRIDIESLYNAEPPTQMTQMKCFHFLSPTEDERSACGQNPKKKLETYFYVFVQTLAVIAVAIDIVVIHS